jgi:hypothetical protein
MSAMARRASCTYRDCWQGRTSTTVGAAATLRLSVRPADAGQNGQESRRRAVLWSPLMWDQGLKESSDADLARLAGGSRLVQSGSRSSANGQLVEPLLVTARLTESQRLGPITRDELATAGASLVATPCRS